MAPKRPGVVLHDVLTAIAAALCGSFGEKLGVETNQSHSVSKTKAKGKVKSWMSALHFIIRWTTQFDQCVVFELLTSYIVGLYLLKASGLKKVFQRNPLLISTSSTPVLDTLGRVDPENVCVKVEQAPHESKLFLVAVEPAGSESRKPHPLHLA